jgi:hypothetical protein
VPDLPSAYMKPGPASEKQNEAVTRPCARCSKSNSQVICGGACSWVLQVHLHLATVDSAHGFQGIPHDRSDGAKVLCESKSDVKAKQT